MLSFVVIIILSYENMITTDNNISYFGFNFNRNSICRYRNTLYALYWRNWKAENVSDTLVN